MKRIFTLIVLAFLTSFSTWSQNYVNYDRDSRWFMGINGGATFHTQTEVPIRYRGGYGFTIGKSIGMHPGKVFSWDVRGRFLHAFVAGQGVDPYNLDSTSTSGLFNYGTSLDPYQDSIGYFIPNFRTTLTRFSLELVLNTNRLRERTGWNFSLFGGIGATGYHVKTDLYQNDFFSNSMYDYNTAGSFTQSNLHSFQDNDFETDLVGTDSDFEWAWMPSFGFGISYQIAPAVAFGFEHKMTWTRTDWFDGMPNTMNGLPSGKNDVYHYTSLGFKFHLWGGDGYVTDTDVDNFDTDTDHNDIVQQPAQKPIIEIYDPGSSPYTTTWNQFTIRARVHHVDGKANISFKQNGNVNSNFSYDPYSDEFYSVVVLNPGQNLFEISAWNDAGSDYETTIIIYQYDVPVQAPPIVTITNPPYSPYNTSDAVFNMTSTVLNVDMHSQIQVYFNGTYVPGFSFNSSSHLVSASLNLIEGTNTVTVTATNNAGSDSKTATIIYTKPATLQPPVVTYVFPSVDPYTHNSSNINVLATVLNVAGQSDITVTVNGATTTNFSYNITTKELLLNTDLSEGANYVTIKAVNAAGMDIESTTIIYSKPQAPKPPIVTYLDPASDPTVVYVSSYNVIAKVENVSGASDITLKINGVVSTAFTYSTSSQLMTFTTALQEGANVIEIKGVNTAGIDIESTTIIYKKLITQAPPVVNITYPATDNTVFNSPNVDLVASVLNVSSASDITVIVNGNSTGAFSFNTATKILNLPLILNEGSNTIQITGTNTAGTDSDTRIIIYQKPAQPAPPTVVFVNPPVSPYMSTVQAYTVMANTTNITSKSQIVFKMNGSVIPDASYTLTSSYQVIYNASLLDGNNIFEISVTNADGYDEALALVTYDEPAIPCVIPTVGYISPVPYSTVTTAGVNIDAQINNYSAGTTVELLVNGVSQGYMTYNAGTSIASKSTTLNPGSNSIKVIVTNSCGTNMATFTLNYQEPSAPCDDPTVTANGASTITTQNSNISVSAISTEVASSSNISVTVNGSSVPFTFDAGTGLISITNANLAIGNNTILISVSNTCGNAVCAFNIVREVCNAPVISNVSPANASTTTNSSVTFTATVNHASSADIILLFNGVSQSFDYNDVTHILTAVLNLEVGTNAIAISANTPCGNASEQITVTRIIPCEPITYSLVNPATSAITVTDQTYNGLILHVNGTINASQISATLNGANVSFNFDVVSGNITIPVLNLVNGMNNLTINLINDCSATSANYAIQYNGCVAPSITITSIANGATVNSSLLPFTAQVLNSNGQANVSLLVNGSSVGFDFNEVNGSLSSNITLNEGSNTITIQVNGCQNASETITVNYVIPCQNIVINLVQPSTNSQVVTEAAYTIVLQAQQVDNAGQISVTLNGAAVPFSFDAGSGMISINGLTLVNGSNTIVVNTTNACSAETTTYTIQYNGCVPPVISLGSNATAVTTPVYSFSASVTNIALQSDIVVLVNGAPVPFIFNPTTGEINAECTLNEGSNAIVIQANGCQNASQTFNVTYTIPCVPISFALGTPSTNSVSVADGNYAIELYAQNANASSITVSLNGATVPFTYLNDIISINGLALNPGNNSVIVNMSNSCSNETVTYTITYNNCNTPVINLSSNSVSSSTASYNFTALTEHVTSAGQLQLTLNGTTVPFNFAGGLVTSNLTLNEGNNTIVLSANTCASATETIQVVYTVPCYPVTYSLQVPAQLNTLVNGATTNISLGVENVNSSSDITATLNGNNVPFNFSSGVITMSGLNLIAGSNTLVITISNQCSSETITYTIESDQCETPIVNITSTNTTVNDPLYALSAQVYNVNNAGDIQVLVNGTSVNFDFNAGSHVLTAQFSLQVGSNAVVIQVNGCESVSSTQTVVYNIPCNPITYTLASPNSNSATVSNESYQISLSTVNVPAESNVTVFLNGNAVPFNFSGNQVNVAGLVLQPGMNTITVNLVNDCSSETITYQITYNAPAPCLAPVISFSSSNNVDNSTYTLQATVTNIDNPSDISVTLNGVPVSASYNASSDVLSATMNLTAGVNTISVTANGCEVASGVYTVTYTPAPPPCNPPVINFSSSANSTDDNYTLTASITNIDNPAAIAVLLNGSPVTATYNTGTDQLTANLMLTDGNNTIQITATGCEVATGSFNVNYDAPDCGTRINPGNSTWEFCLVTPGATYTRDNLANDNYFTYSGPATSLFCKPIAGGGDAFVNGQVYPISVGQYYLFTGNLTVTVANDNPAAMGHWEVCIQSDTEPVYGNGGNRPTSPCEAAPCDAPVISFTSSTTATAENYNLTASVSNIDNPANISVTLNGQPVSASYNTGSDQLNATLTLASGNNTIAITANGCSSASGNLVVNYTPAPGDDDIDFDIQNNGGVTVNETACATITCLGESVVYNNSQEAYVKIQFSLNGGSSWYGFANDNNIAGGEQVSVNTPAGSNVVIKAICTNANQNWTNTLVSNSGSEWVYVLKNGDVAPSFDPAQGQQSLDAFLSGYINSNGVVTIGPNDVIYLFELRHVGDVGIDYQDAVMLVTFSDDQNCPAPMNPKSAGGQQTGEVYQKPTFTNIAPAKTSIEVTSPQFNFRLGINNVNAGEDITVTVNGSAASGFTYNVSSRELSGTMNLVQGANVVAVTAVNGNQTSTASYTINYTASTTNNTNNVDGRSTQPVISPIAPAGQSETVSSSTYMFKAKVTNVVSKSDIKLYLNGSAVTGFTYSTSTGEVTAVLTLNSGANTIKLDAVNADKSASSTWTITYSNVVNPGRDGNQNTDTNNDGGTNNGTDGNTRPVYEQPVIGMIAPASSSESVTSSTYMFKASVSNVSSKSDIKITFNGTSFTGFTYSSSSQQITAVLTLRSGSNTVKVDVVNGDKTASTSYTITYTEVSDPQRDGNQNNGGGTTTDPNRGGGTTTDPNKGGGTTTDPNKGGGTTTDPNKGGGTTTDPNKGGGTTTDPNRGGGTTTDPNKGGGTTTDPNKGGGTTTDPNRGGGTTTGGGRGGLE